MKRNLMNHPLLFGLCTVVCVFAAVLFFLMPVSVFVEISGNLLQATTVFLSMTIAVMIMFANTDMNYGLPVKDKATLERFSKRRHKLIFDIMNGLKGILIFLGLTLIAKTMSLWFINSAASLMLHCCAAVIGGCAVIVTIATIAILFEVCGYISAARELAVKISFDEH